MIAKLLKQKYSNTHFIYKKIQELKLHSMIKLLNILKNFGELLTNKKYVFLPFN